MKPSQVKWSSTLQAWRHLSTWSAGSERRMSCSWSRPPASTRRKHTANRAGTAGLKMDSKRASSQCCRGRRAGHARMKQEPNALMEVGCCHCLQNSGVMYGQGANERGSPPRPAPSRRRPEWAGRGASPITDEKWWGPRADPPPSSLSSSLPGARRKIRHLGRINRNKERRRGAQRDGVMG